MNNQNSQQAGDNAKQIAQIGQAESIDLGSGSIRIEKDAIGSAIISGDGNRVVIYQYQILRQVAEDLSARVGEIGPNPYKGLLAFQETDGKYFFGRSEQIEQLWNKFRSIHEGDSTIRLLPIYGPSGSGKSSLARAGLIPDFARRPLPGHTQARVAVLVPGTRPLEALACVLARVATNDPTPVEKAEEFERVLKKKREKNQDEGLRRIAAALPEIATSPLIVLVDQFEEIYTLCEDPAERDRFVNTLLDAAGDHSGYVSVILTLRSDFLGETQKHPILNALFADHGFLVRSMNEAELRQAISEPAKRVGHSLDTATVDLMIRDTQGREGALPLLQFALTRIWEGLAEKEPAEMLKAIGGVGGALAGEAQRIYDSLSPVDQAIARRVFLGLVQLGDVIKYTRRRVVTTSLVSPFHTAEQVKQIIARFASQDVRLITLSNHADGETAEITHEALFENWQAFQSWLEDNTLFLTWRDSLQVTIRQWDMGDRDPEALLRGKSLAEAEDWFQKQEADLSQIEHTYIQASLAGRDRLQKDEKERQQREYDLLKKFVSTAQLRTKLAISAIGLMIVTLITGGFAWYQQQRFQKTEKAFLLGFEPAKPELLKELPNFLKEADRLRSSKKEEDIQLALAYYRKILTDTHTLDQAMQSTPKMFQKPDEQAVKLIARKAENGLVETIRIYQIPKLKAQLKDRKWGSINEQKPPTEIEHRFTGALRTTAEILMSNLGAKADLNGNGRIDNKEQAERLPCETLREIEELWRQFTNQHCGWYGSTNEYQEPTCIQLDKKTLTLTVFTRPYSEIMKQLNSCPGILKPSKVNSQK